MIIQCSHCGAPLDIKGEEKLIKCVYCSATNRIANARTVVPVTPPDWRPPAEWRPPPHIRGGTVLPYHRPTRAAPIVAAVVALVGGVTVAATISSSGRRASSQMGTQPGQAQVAGAESAVRAAQASAKEALRAVERAHPSAQSVDYFAQGGAEQAVASFKSALHTAKITANELVLYPTYAILEAQDPTNPKHVDRYLVRAGVVEPPEPITNNSLPSDIEKRWFDPDRVSLGKVPELISRTVKKLDYEQGNVSHIIIESNLPFSKDLVIRVYVSGPRDSGRIDYRADGTELRVFR